MTEHNPALLFLAHRIPYPPNKGDKIRSYHLLKYLAQHYRVYLGAFVDDPGDWRYGETLREMCAESHLVSLSPAMARLRSLAGLWRREPLTLSYYWDSDLRQWVDTVVRRAQIKRIVVFSSAMAQYAVHHAGQGVRMVVDYVDIDSDKWAQYGETRSWPQSWVYRHEAQALSRYEQRAASRFDATVFVSRAEAHLFKARVPALAQRITHVNNGVDSDYFEPAGAYANPYEPGRKVIVFTGMMDYWPNMDAVRWFSREVFPLIRESVADAWFYIVGARPAEEVRQLDELPNITVTGDVEDIRPYLAHARVAVAPLRVARGVQNKVLEAMAMAKPVVATSMAMEGIETDIDMHGMDTEREFAARVIEQLGNGPGHDWRLRDCVLRFYDWHRNLKSFTELLEKPTQARSAA